MCHRLKGPHDSSRSLVPGVRPNASEGHHIIPIGLFRTVGVGSTLKLLFVEVSEIIDVDRASTATLRFCMSEWRRKL